MRDRTLRDREYRSRHPERARAKVKARMRKWRASHRQQSRDSARAWKAINPRWSTQNREAATLLQQTRNARQRGAPGDGITRDQWLAVLREYGGRCAYCARVLRLTLDHVDPLSKGGAHDIANAAPACGECNSSKSNKTLLLWLRSAKP